MNSRPLLSSLMGPYALPFLFRRARIVVERAHSHALTLTLFSLRVNRKRWPRRTWLATARQRRSWRTRRSAQRVLRPPCRRRAVAHVPAGSAECHARRHRRERSLSVCLLRISAPIPTPLCPLPPPRPRITCPRLVRVVPPVLIVIVRTFFDGHRWTISKLRPRILVRVLVNSNRKRACGF